MKVPFVDLKAQYADIRDEINRAIQDVLDSAAFAGGPFVERFERAFADYCGCGHAIAVNSGTTALWASMMALGIGPGDEVITVPSTFAATAEAVCICGASPVFVDIDPRTYTLDVSRLEAAVTPRTKAILPVHLMGQVADMDPILEVARQRGLYVIEDACQAHGATYKGRRAGSLGDAACFSFYPSKNLGAYGEGGAITTNDSALADHLRMFRDHGQRKRYDHAIVGWNARMDGLQGAILSVKLKYLDRWNELRRTAAARYKQQLDGLPGLVLPAEASYGQHIYHVFAVRHPDRDAIAKHLGDAEIGWAIHYPVPVHLQVAFAFLECPKGSFPVAEQCAGELLSLPMFPELSVAQIEYVSGEVRKSLTG